MKRVFTIEKPFRVPDGTLVSPFLNPKDSMSGLPFDLLEVFSLAAGTIEPKTKSKIHVMPFVTQVTFVRHGELTVRMKGHPDRTHYALTVLSNQAVLTEPGTFFQLVNEGDGPCKVLYIVSPAYLFEMSGGKVVYDDSVVLEQEWNDLESAEWRPPLRLPTNDQRREAERRLSERSK